MRSAAIAIALALGLVLAPDAFAGEITFDFTGAEEFSGSGAGDLVGSVKVTLTDLAGGDVKITVETSGFSGGTLDKVYLNIDGIGTQTFSDSVSAGGGVPVDYDIDITESNTGPHKADGGGYYDVVIDFDQLGSGETVMYTLAMDNFSTAFTAADFVSLADSSGGNGPHQAAIHIHDNTGEKSGHYAATYRPVPEPGTILLMTGGLAGLVMARRRRRAA